MEDKKYGVTMGLTPLEYMRKLKENYTNPDEPECKIIWLAKIKTAVEKDEAELEFLKSIDQDYMGNELLGDFGDREESLKQAIKEGKESKT
jgi:hypothetical protein